MVELDPSDINARLRSLPGFAGFFIGPAGVPTLLLTDLARRAEAERALAPFLQTLDAGGQVEVAQAQFSSAELEGWFHRASGAVLREAGVVFIDNDEERNRVTVGLENLGVANSVRAVLRRQGVPDAAIRFQETDAFVEAVTLRERVRPVRGGLQIAWVNNSDGTSLCTLGFNTFNTPSLARSFITNSHCTRTRGIVSPATVYHQPTIVLLGGNRIGSEVEDPPFFFAPTFGCPLNRRCRRSDAARANYNSTTTSTLGRIMRPTDVNSITIATVAGLPLILATFRIVGEGVPVVGQTANKVGRTTGWDFGRVNQTCANVNVLNTNITMICQDVVGTPSSAAPIVRPGDSGSPVFTRVSRLNYDVILRGILWGGNTAGTQFVFSRLSLVEAELGPQQTF